ncbi:MAG: SPFH domain-containing protein [Planctomycetota bacterium]|jgi:regulator of protease activity HflC (stomatin/prohibitin superfamily)
MSKAIARALVVLLFVGGVLYGGVEWFVNRVYVPEGHSLLLRYKGPLIFGARNEATPGHFADEGEIGVLERLRGPGRHFYCPIWWKRTIVPDIVIRPGEIGVVRSMLGDPLPSGEFLVDGELGNTQHKGILRKAYGPGRFRVNTHAYQFEIIKTQREDDGTQVKHSGWVEIPTGYVGVVTLLADNPITQATKGIQANVLPPGLYPVNPKEQQVDIVEIGFRETSIVVDQQMQGGGVAVDESGEPVAVADSGITFPSNDGFNIQLDFTAIWGIMPVQAPQIVSTFGNVEAVEDKVIEPQSESICRNNGSKMGAVELLVGESRLEFQADTSTSFQEVLRDKNVTLLYGLVRHIYIPQEVRIPIQEGYIADELTLTREQEKITATTEANLREAEKRVELEAERVRVETDKMVANTIAEGAKKAGEIDAESQQLVAAVDKQIATLQAERTVVVGEANASAQRMAAEAKAQKFQLAVAAFSTPSAYSKWEFAEGLPNDVDLQLIYAGEGTLWTDLKNIVPTLPLRAPEQPKGN